MRVLDGEATLMRIFIGENDKHGHQPMRTDDGRFADGDVPGGDVDRSVRVRDAMRSGQHVPRRVDGVAAIRRDR